MTSYLALFDTHWGYDQRPGRTKAPLHDRRTLDLVLKVASDFKPDVLILGGDTLDCGPLSPHLKHKHRSIEGLRIATDAQELRAHVLEPLEQLGSKRIYLLGNHERWPEDVIEEYPGLEGVLSINALLGLEAHGWQIVPQGELYRLGKLFFMHGDTIKGSTHVAKAAMDRYDRNVRFGHFHTYQAYTKHRPLDIDHPKTAIAVPCLCGRDALYMMRAPNRWVQGFAYGHVEPNGIFHDQVSTVINHAWTAPWGTRYKG